MLLVIDVGNSNNVIGLFSGEKLLTHWRIRTESNRTSDEYWVLLKEFIFGILIFWANVSKRPIGLILSYQFSCYETKNKLWWKLKHVFFTMQVNITSRLASSLDFLLFFSEKNRIPSEPEIRYQLFFDKKVWA